VDAEALKALFEPFGSITVKRMFGGSGIYAEGLCFAIETDGEVSLKTDGSFASRLFSGGFRAIHLCGEGQVETDVLLELAGDRSRRGRRAAPVGADGTGRGAARGCRPGEG
jgi:hypothetical protein